LAALQITRGNPFFDSLYWRICCLLGALVLLWTDSLTPLGFAHGSLYLFVVLLAALTTNERFLLTITTVAILFTVLGIFISPPGITLGYVISNRILSILELCLMCGSAIMVSRQMASHHKINTALLHSQSVIDEQRNLLEIATSTARMGGWSMSVPDGKLSWSDYVCKLHGMHPGVSPDLEQALGLYLPEWRDTLRQALKACAEHGVAFEQEAELQTAAGRRTWVRISGLPVRNATLAITAIHGSLQDITAEKQSQSILVQLRQRFHQLADAIPQIIWTAEPDGAADYANKALLDYCGLRDGKALTGRGWAALVHPDDLAAAVESWLDAVKGQQTFYREFRFRRSDGTYRWHAVRAQAIKDAQGKVVKWSGSAVDVHEVRELATRQINILESITDAFITIDDSWHFTYVNKEAERLLQRSREQLLGTHVWDMYPDAQNFEVQLRRAMTGGITVNFREYYAGMDKWFDLRVFPAEEGLVIYFRDVTAEHLQAEENRQARERFEILARATTDAVWDWNLLTDQTWWNDSMLTLFGYAPAEIEPDSRSWTSHLHPDDMDRVLTGIHDVLAGSNSEWQDEYRFCRKDGTYAYVLDKGFIIRDRNGQPVRMVGGMMDITETKLLQERLVQSQRLEALGQLTGGVAHDFNNLLTVILGNGELLTEQLQEDPEKFALIDLVNKAATRASQLTRHLLAFARRQPLEPDVTDVKKLINGMESLLRRTLMENFSIEFVHAGGLWPALVDPAQLENAVLNLCLNARDAMPDGGMLTIETSNASLDQNYALLHDEVQAGQYVMIGVTDNGCGMSTETLQHVFDPFFTTKSPGKGTGLGLSMVYGFVKQSKGHIKIYTEVGQGTTVRMYLPRALEPSMHELPVVTPLLRGGNEVILLVEDDEMVRMYAQTLLLDMGYQVLTAESGPQALSVLQQNPQVRLLFTDVIMPGGMNGRQLADAACRMRPDLKVLFTSGYTENAIVHHGRLDPGVNLLSKPYQRKDLINKLRLVLGTAL
jgi:PAS domain S-box-containing protein